MNNAWQGGLLAVALIFLFLMNWRPTLIIGVSIPLSIITTFIALYFAGYTLNLLTLGGLALGIGMLVDNSIVVIENMFRHVQEGKDPKTAAKLGASEVGMAITASTLTTIVVFLPMAFATGLTGMLTRGLGPVRRLFPGRLVVCRPDHRSDDGLGSLSAEEDESTGDEKDDRPRFQRRPKGLSQGPGMGPPSPENGHLRDVGLCSPSVSP